MQTSAEVSVSQTPVYVLIDHADISRGVSVANAVLCSIVWLTMQTSAEVSVSQIAVLCYIVWLTMQTSDKVSVSQIPFYVL